MKQPQTSSCALLALVACIALQNSHAAGRINFVAGSVSVTTVDGHLRIPGTGERIETGDAIHTGRDGEVHVHMDDNGLIALRANTFLKIEAYRADGGAQDSAVFRLLRGSLRSITGWIGRNNTQRYAVRTPTATIGSRGADHETLVREDGEKAGSYERVNSGETELSTPLGKVSVASGQAAFAPQGTVLPPSRLAVIASLFTPTDNESRIDADKAMLEATRDEKLRSKQQDNVRKGVGNDGKPRIGDPRDARRALAAFEDMLRAFEAGNVSLIRARLDPSMIGLQQLLDGIAQDANECKQMRVTMLNTQVQAGPEMAIIQTNWEKRCLMLPAFTARVTAGRSTILLHLVSGGWRFAAITGGNMFERPVPVVTPPVVTPPVVTPPVVVVTPPAVTPPVLKPPVVIPPVVTPPVVTPPVVTPPVVVPPVVEPPIVTPPVVTPPVVTPPVVTPPIVTPPVVIPPVVTPPVVTPPVVTPPVVVPPVVEPPIVTPPIVTPPIVTPPIVTPPIVTPPVVTPPVVTPPVVTPPVVIPPVVTPPVVTPPVVAPPVVTPPVVEPPIVTPPVVTPPVVTPPVVTPPVVTPPVVTPPVVTPPVVEPPIVTPPVVTPPVVTPPVVTPPVVTPPVVTPPVVAPPVITPPVVTPPVVTPPVVTRTLARLTVGAGAGTSYSRAAALPGSSMLPFSISLTDPDSAGVGSVMVTVRTSGGDSQTIMLPATRSGTFSVSGLFFSQAATTRLNPVCGTNRPSNAGSLEICPGGSVTVSYTDTSTPSGSPQTVSATAVVN